MWNMHGGFEQIAYNHISGQHCPVCANRNYTTEIFVTKADIIHNGEYKYDLAIYAGSWQSIIIHYWPNGDFPMLSWQSIFLLWRYMMSSSLQTILVVWPSLKMALELMIWTWSLLKLQKLRPFLTRMASWYDLCIRLLKLMESQPQLKLNILWKLFDIAEQLLLVPNLT